MKLRVVIPSRRRSKTIEEAALAVFPQATVCVAESERDDYRRVTKNIITHPDDVSGMGPLRQWMLDNISDECLFMVDDDVHACVSLVGNRLRRITDPQSVMQIVLNTAECAYAAGARVFGFNQAWDVRKYDPWRPIRFTGWVGAVFGVIGRELRFEPLRVHGEDIDLCLQSLLKHRIIWQESRISFMQKRFTNAGGNSINRSADLHEREINFVCKKWGRYVKVQRGKTAIRLIVQVRR
jgi:hypothetical protein